MLKKEKNKVIWKYRDKDKDKAKSLNSSFANMSEPQTQAFKKDKHYKRRWGDHSATGVNATQVNKKNKDKAKDLSHIEYYTCKHKD